eukprot:2684833-Amphidinium_carterae.1
MVSADCQSCLVLERMLASTRKAARLQTSSSNKRPSHHQSVPLPSFKTILMNTFSLRTHKRKRERNRTTEEFPRPPPKQRSTAGDLSMGRGRKG